VLTLSGRYDKAEQVFARSMPLVEKFGDVELLSGSLVMYANVLLLQGREEEAA
jgi:hypothetical protein